MLNLDTKMTLREFIELFNDCETPETDENSLWNSFWLYIDEDDDDIIKIVPRNTVTIG